MAAAPWIGAFVVLGARLRRYRSKLGDRQLVVAVSVPRRDYAAALIGAGWVLSGPPPNLDEPIEVFRSASSSTYLRGVTDNRIVTGAFSWLEENRSDPRVLVGGKLLRVERFKAVAALEMETPSIDGYLPSPGFLAEFTGASGTWLERLAAPPMDLALVGTAKWLCEDLESFVGNAAEPTAEGTPLCTYVLPDGKRAPTWSTLVVPSARLGDGEMLPESCTTVILERYSAIKYLNDVTAPIVVCIVDRSIADESAAEKIIEARLRNSRPISVVRDLCWIPPQAVEALAFAI
ncbi:hypothetical protein GV793_28225 [Nocardia cyriacigeorgica]|nr:hypothetical protein [Nocardia cyriacigeorgica]